eukprot:1655160-Pyramimonas_sp.AAC.1
MWSRRSACPDARCDHPPRAAERLHVTCIVRAIKAPMRRAVNDNIARGSIWRAGCATICQDTARCNALR